MEDFLERLVNLDDNNMHQKVMLQPFQTYDKSQSDSLNISVTHFWVTSTLEIYQDLYHTHYSYEDKASHLYKCNKLEE